VHQADTSTARRGRFITIEGPEGGGKTLLAAALYDALSTRGVPVRLTREPGGTSLGDRVRSMVLDHLPDEPPLAPRADALLFAAARAQHVNEVIEPALARGEAVLSARYADSSVAYQGYGLGLPLAEMLALQAFATDGLRPDLTLLLDLPAEVGLARKQDDEQTRFEAGFDLAYHRRVRDGFLAIAAGEPERFLPIDATATVEVVFEVALAAVLALLHGSTEPSRSTLRMQS
jgi:dTMP kinase